MEPIRVIATFPAIPEGSLAKFKEAAAQALEVAKKEPGLRQYDWFVNEDGTMCVIHEEYEHSAAILAHVINLGPLIDTLFDVGGGGEFKIFGNPTSELREAIAGLDVSIFPSRFQSK